MPGTSTLEVPLATFGRRRSRFQQGDLRARLCQRAIAGFAAVVDLPSLGKVRWPRSSAGGRRPTCLPGFVRIVQGRPLPGAAQGHQRVLLRVGSNTTTPNVVDSAACSSSSVFGPWCPTCVEGQRYRLLGESRPSSAPSNDVREVRGGLCTGQLSRLDDGRLHWYLVLVVRFDGAVGGDPSPPLEAGNLPGRKRPPDLVHAMAAAWIRGEVSVACHVEQGPYSAVSVSDTRSARSTGRWCRVATPR